MVFVGVLRSLNLQNILHINFYVIKKKKKKEKKKKKKPKKKPD